MSTDNQYTELIINKIKEIIRTSKEQTLTTSNISLIALSCMGLMNTFKALSNVQKKAVLIGAIEKFIRENVDDAALREVLMLLLGSVASEAIDAAAKYAKSLVSKCCV